MWIFSEKRRLSRTLSGYSEVYTYSIEDLPGKTLGVKIPRNSMKAAKHALLHAHDAPARIHAVHKLDRNELIKAVKELDKAARGKAGHYYLLGPSATHLGKGLTVGARILSSKAGQEILSIRSEVLNNHQYVDIHRAAGQL